MLKLTKWLNIEKKSYLQDKIEKKCGHQKDEFSLYNTIEV